MDKKQIGQLFIVGYQGEEPSSEFLRFVEEWGTDTNLSSIQEFKRLIVRNQDGASIRIEDIGDVVMGAASRPGWHGSRVCLFRGLPAMGCR